LPTTRTRDATDAAQKKMPFNPSPRNLKRQLRRAEQAA
jgi:hypothetical protein